jgi:hypothetical protein
MTTSLPSAWMTRSAPAAGQRGLRPVEAVDVRGRFGDEFFQPAFAHHRPAAAGDGSQRLVEGAADRFDGGRAAQTRRVPARGQRQQRVGGVHVGDPWAAMRDASH